MVKFSWATSHGWEKNLKSLSRMWSKSELGIRFLICKWTFRWDFNLEDVGFQLQKFCTIQMHMLQNIGTNGRIKPLQCMPQWGRNVNGLYYKHMCIMYSCIYMQGCLHDGNHHHVCSMYPMLLDKLPPLDRQRITHDDNGMYFPLVEFKAIVVLIRNWLSSKSHKFWMLVKPFLPSCTTLFLENPCHIPLISRFHHRCVLRTWCLSCGNNIFTFSNILFHASPILSKC